nr:MAG TPA: hypothetical protein [Caudoviricetes sp.]
MVQVKGHDPSIPYGRQILLTPTIFMATIWCLWSGLSYNHAYLCKFR